jgi:hypothetical protein
MSLTRRHAPTAPDEIGRGVGSLLYQLHPKTGEFAKLRAARPEGERVRDLQHDSSVSHANYTRRTHVFAALHRDCEDLPLLAI